MKKQVKKKITVEGEISGHEFNPNCGHCTNPGASAAGNDGGGGEGENGNKKEIECGCSNLNKGVKCKKRHGINVVVGFNKLNTGEHTYTKAYIQYRDRLKWERVKKCLNCVFSIKSGPLYLKDILVGSDFILDKKKQFMPLDDWLEHIILGIDKL